MSHTSSSSSFQLLFNATLQDYANQTGTKLDEHPLAKQLESCDSVNSITAILQENAQKFQEFRGEDGKIMKSLKCAVHDPFSSSYHHHPLRNTAWAQLATPPPSYVLLHHCPLA
jgi:hypothetical protein